MNEANRIFVFAVLCSALFLLCPSTQAKDDWPSIPPADLALKDNPARPGAKAMVLLRSAEINDRVAVVREYVRIKIFTEEGKGFADVTIPPLGQEFKVRSVQGRTIHPDGTIVPFSGQVFEKIVEKRKGHKVTTKSFSLPDVTPGSIVEYRYELLWETGRAFDSMWEVQLELFQREAHFSFVPLTGFSHSVHATALPEGAKFNSGVLDTKVTLDLANIPEFEPEPFMPPRFERAMRVMFFYSGDTTRLIEGDDYWRINGNQWAHDTESFMDKKGALQGAVASLTSPADSPETKARKFYDYVQGFENLSFEPKKSEKELKALHMKEVKNVEDVIRKKYGSRTELNRTFVALARTAGIEATLLKVAERDDLILHKEWPWFDQIGPELAVLRMNGKQVNLDPGSPDCPFGVLPWESTLATGLLLTKQMPTWITTPEPQPDNAVMKRVAKLTLAEDGSVSGEVELTLNGLYAYLSRFNGKDDDATERKKKLEKYLEDWMVVKGDIELLEVNDWKNSNLPFVAKFKVTLPGYASQVGKRTLLPGTFFQGSYKNPFTATKRIHPILMEYSFDDNDDVTITLPKSYQLESLPKALSDKNAVADITAGYANDNGTLHFTREFKLKGVMLETKYYPALRQFFQKVQAEANEQAVLKTAKE